ncbi:hypothetical protein KVR01_000845 [Diaporthe batatas]|uniref:uncharacterized protein n=1 Tax=Diaporthe batatas TaxID=748121 RepID=UPI001D059928|nr:uncharacterized protein KVR01_000845 [Diaporthe batatas]KAG8170100.1 hypothetical protein KVR01_000845 [Diaporthe batatas]
MLLAKMSSLTRCSSPPWYSRYPTFLPWQRVKADISTYPQLSVILYGRQAFPENCFRELSVQDILHPSATHNRLLESGRRLSNREDPLQTLCPNRDTLVYLKECDNPRLLNLLADLDQIFAAIADRLLGKVYICFNDTKEWSRDSLIECFTLQFSYNKQGDLFAYAHWAGKGDSPFKGSRSRKLFDSEAFFEDLKQVVLTCPQLPDRFYTRLFVSAVNKQTKLQGDWAGYGHGVREALSDLEHKQGASRLRIGSFIREVVSEEADQNTDQDLPEQWLGTSPTLGSDSPYLNLAASPTRPSSLSNPKKRPRLAMIEEVPEDLPPTQRLQTPVRSQRIPKSTSANPAFLSTDSEASPSPLAEDKRLARVWSTEEESPQGTWQASQSHASRAASTARTYGDRSKTDGKRARTMA